VDRATAEMGLAGDPSTATLCFNLVPTVNE